MTPISKKKSVKKVVVKETISPKKKNQRTSRLARANLLAFVAVLIVNYLANALPLWGNTTGALSDMYPSIFTPAGLTFSIWGIIYLALLWFVIWQLIDVYAKKTSGITKKIGIWFLLSCATNIGWLFAWHYTQVGLSVLVMILFLVVLIVIGEKVDLGKKLWTIKDKYFVQVPFSLYLGRICVAIIANISTRLIHIWRTMRRMTDIFWTILVIIVAALLALIQLYKKNNIIFALVVVWAFLGIIIKRVQVDPVYAQSIIRTTGICIALITAAIGRRYEAWKKN